MKFSEKIVRLRKIKGITQDEFANAVGVSRQAVYKWECGQSYPEAMKLVEIKALFGISLDDLFDDSYEIALPEKKKRKRISKPKAEIVKEKTVTEEIVSEPVTESEDVTEEAAPMVEATVESAAVEDAVEEIKEETVTEVAERIIEEIKDEEPVYTAPVKEEAPVSEAAPAPAPETVSAPVSEENTVEKKRGFWSRIFGRK